MDKIQINCDTRHELIRFALQNIQLYYDFKKYKDRKLDYILCDCILSEMFKCITFQRFKFNELFDNTLNRYLYYVLEELKVYEYGHLEQKKRLLRLFKIYKVNKELTQPDKIMLSSSNDRKLIKYCELYLEYNHTYKNYEADNENNNIASDKFLFEKVIKQVAIDLYDEKHVKQKIKGIDDIGQSLTADTIISTDCNTILIDAKFYNSDLIYKHKNSDKVTYRHQDNRFQMNAYMDELKYQGYKNIVGIIVHAIDKERQERFECLNGHSMNIADNNIKLEFIRIDTSAKEIISQIKSMITKYTELSIY